MAAITATPLVQSPSAQSSASSSSSLATLSSPGSATSASSSSSIATINTLELSSSSSDESSNETAIGSTRTTSTRRPKSSSSSKKERSHFPRHTLLDYDNDYRGTTMRDIAEESTSPNAGPSSDQHFVGNRQHLVRSHTVDSVPRIGLHQLAEEEGTSATSISQSGLNQHHPPAVRARAHSSRNLSSLGSSAVDSTPESVYPYTSQLPVSSGSSRRAAGLGSRNISRSPPLSNDILPSQSASYFETSPNRIPPAQQGCPSSDSEASRHLARLSLSATNPDLSRRQKSSTTSEVGGADLTGGRNNSGSIDASQRYRKTSLGNAFNPTSRHHQASIPRSQSQYPHQPPHKRTLSEFSSAGSTMPAPLLHSHTVPSGVPTFTNSSASTSRRPTSLVDPYSYSASSAEVNNPNISPNRATRQAYNPSGTSDTLLSAERQSPQQGGSSASGSGYGNSAAGTRYETEREAARSNQLEAKIVLLGRQGVGKTSLVHRYMTGQFSSSLPTTIGASFLVKKLVMDGVKVRLQIWDTAGQERFRSMAPMYYRGAHAAILVYDITSEDSLADVRVWLDELRRNMSSDLIVQIVGNKVDAAHHRKVDLEAAKLLIEKWLVEDDPAAKGRTASETLSPTRESSRAGGLPSFGLSRSNSNRSRAGTMPSSSSVNTLSPASSSLLRINFAASSQNPQANQPDLPAFKDIGISEVSAKADFDESIEDLFLTITSKLVERKVQIEHDRVLRSKDSIMITKEGDSKVQDATRIWGCC